MRAAALRSEWIKFRTLRSIIRTAIAAVLVSIAITYLHSRGYHLQPGDDPTTITMFGLTVGMFFFALAGSMVATSEWTGATIRATIAATPHRYQVARSKAALVLILSIAAGTVTALVCFAVGRAALVPPTPGASFARAAVWRTLAGTVLVTTLISLLGLGLGLLFRRAVGAVVSIVVVLYLLPPLTSVLGPATRRSIVPYMPDQLIGPIINGHRVLGTVESLSPWTAMIVLGIQVLLVTGLGALTLSRADL